jgi:adenosylmethionine-8-amino-7-oxononanoate aminotransferase
MLVCRDEGVEPDFLCLAKGLSAGYLPLAATLAREEIYEAFLGPFETGTAFIHGHTFTANPLAAAVSLTSLRKLIPMIDNGDLAERSTYFGQRLAWPCSKAIQTSGNFASVALRLRSTSAQLTPRSPPSPLPPGSA